MCYLSKNSSKYFSFCDTIFSSRERSGRICYLPYCIFQKIKKGTPPWYVKVGGHPMESVSHGLWEEKWGGVSSFIKEHKCANFSQNFLSMEYSENPIASRWQEQPPLKTFLSLFYKSKALAHAKSLLPSAKGLFFFYVESSPSTFMHRLREHSCHSEYNMHGPKIYYWLIHDYGFTCS
jgi:hypothetical protein